MTSGWAWLFAQPLSGNVVVKSLMHSEGQNKEGFVNVGTRLESLTLEAFQACLQKNNDCESGITKCFLGFYVSKKRAILFYFLQPASIQLLVFASGASVPTGSAENIPLYCPLHEKVPRVSYTVILKSPLLCPLSNEHKKRWRKFRCHENCLTLQMLDLRRPSYFPLRR